MKFGGVSLASANSIRQVIAVIRSEMHRRPVVVASASGDTTEILLQILAASRKANSYSAWKLQEALKNHHFALSEELLRGEHQSATERYFQETFRDLHVRMLELCEGERPFTPELQDWTVSLGEQLSSRLLAAVLQEHCGDTVHLDSRKLILTDDEFSSAQPCQWETYARIRWAVPIVAKDKLVVLGGFIGSTADGRTTTLGRGGSDLTASLVGAAINAEEIQVWKDVDGMLTCDPRLRRGAHQVKRLSYEEASELAHAGATILHPETMAPAKRLRIPIVIRNTFRPAGAGTRIECSTAAHTSGLVKSIAVKKNVTLLEIHSSDLADSLESLVSFCRKHSAAATVVCSSERAVYLAVSANAKIPDEGPMPDRCLDVRVRSEQAILTLVGTFHDKEMILRRLAGALQGSSAFIIPSVDSTYSVRIAVPQNEVCRYLDVLHHVLFANADPACFVAAELNDRSAEPALTRARDKDRDVYAGLANVRGLASELQSVSS